MHCIPKNFLHSREKGKYVSLGIIGKITNGVLTVLSLTIEHYTAVMLSCNLCTNHLTIEHLIASSRRTASELTVKLLTVGQQQAEE